MIERAMPDLLPGVLNWGCQVLATSIFDQAERRNLVI
jgi:hypothetical protein